ncbi:MAG: hypothetical protein AABZ58_06550, partial [Chloroflexota bacterium]
MTHKFYRMLAALVVAAIFVTACGSTATPTPEPQAEADPQPSAEPEPSPETDPGAPGAEGPLAPGALVIYSGRREPLIQPVIDAYKAKYQNIDVVLKSGGNSELANG